MPAAGAHPRVRDFCSAGRSKIPPPLTPAVGGSLGIGGRGLDAKGVQVLLDREDLGCLVRARVGDRPIGAVLLQLKDAAAGAEDAGGELFLGLLAGTPACLGSE